MVPTYPTAHLVVAQPHFALAGREQLLHPVAAAVDSHYLGQRHIGRRVRQRVPTLRLPIRRADHDQPLTRPHPTVLVLGLHPGFHGPHHVRPFGTRAETDFTPTPTRQRLGPVCRPPPGRPPPTGGGDL